MILARRISLALLVIMLVLGCASTPKARYGQALNNFDAVMDSYRYYYDAADPATQAEWRTEISPIMREASKALDQWKLSLNDVTKEQAYVNLYRQGIALLLKYGITTGE